MNGIKVNAQMYRDHGQWILSLTAPEWVVKEWTEQWHAGGKMGISGYGGEYQGGTLDMSIVMMPKEEATDAQN